MLNKLKQFYSLFQQGRQVSDPAFWKKGQAYVQPIVAALIMTVVALAKGFGYDLPVSDDLAYTIAGALFFIVNGILTVVTTKHLGLPARALREAQPPVPAAPEAAEQPAEMAANEAMPSVSEARVGQQAADSIDEATRQRAIEWVKQHSVQPNRFNNGLQNDA